ncbi:MAG: dihydrofolate reductase family protein [candidate division Zixibacteria bacterium]|nr:dihydrofolate reductase family protein [candidate division Zixibacteria bacterium]
MRRLMVFNSVSLDGYFTDKSGDMSWAYNVSPDAEWDAFVAGNASGEGVLLFGRVTYDLMAGFWPTPQAAQQMPEVAEGMNKMPKVVFSRTMEKAAWNNTTLVRDDLASAVRKLKNQPGPDMVILGSGSIVAQLARAGLVDEYQFVVVPVVLGGGRTMFEGLKEKLTLKRIESRVFGNGNVFLRYEPAA